MSYTFDQLKKKVGKKIKYYDDTNGWKTGRDVTEDDIGEFINEVYIEELFPAFAARYPHMFRQTGYLDSWIVSGTVHSSSTGSTLIATSSIFTNGMVGLKVYNETDEETVEITGYTSGTTVTIDTTIDDTWDGDTIYIIGKEFSFGGDATDLFSVESISVKYDSADTTYNKAELRELEDLYPVGDEIGTQSNPFSYLTVIKTSSGLKQGFGVFPQLDEKVSKAIFINYIAKPVALSADGDIPIIPTQSSLICGATVKCFENMQNFSKANYWLGKYELAQKRDLSRYRPKTSSRLRKIRISGNAYLLHSRIK